ncbi:MAG TPA: 1-deoxy-D-xylulose-5-phosphate synthase [Elusimicrobia bacterium]|nr:MAG: 1-deoxy-D-xylulose-5-phosphate synthase [Elusimicrobia bacterium RIFOXYA12_FULL_49_49]OGS10997.1 MAG: 1-deoxy-D-xylulose-5-phosphate synthase [Elusimicrobia bacterium RIFOXYB1_FULL_48_9]OGS15167.1 MAG: 1-deoxy-D-xylulose-5-phosphate synthase [Elusimicrobia bacterium RIFOXYA2_FULL_47_53]OGS29787.1 MAG: 1-deoxy-D-xylulose-5-phosphate synthase [Elusimicrobia bacterium RIFOXYB2_FULL_46_23]HBU70270.1 1-deoxy-D-xylulose-5-phosphate synthase [Elusimicrobiota bacterium]
MTVLDMINKPNDLRNIKRSLLPDLAAEIREKIISTVSKNGGHLAPSLGTVELTIALHYVFDAPKDKLLWDVGHQAYAHKILTGRKDTFDTLRTFGGLSGFPKISESEYDAFGVGHSSTSISAALGMAVARDLKHEDNKVVAIIGDGSMTGGLAFEGLQNAGHLGSDLLVILNDNQMFISHRVGALAGYLTKLLTAGTFKKLEKRVEQFFQRMHFWGSSILRVAKRFKVLLFPGMLFEEMGFAYVGPVDGHDIERLIEIFSNIKKLKGPVLLHVITKKGKGYSHAEKEAPKFHGIGKFDVETGEPLSTSSVPSYTEVFSDTLTKIAESDEKITAITAAMPEGTGLDTFASKFKDRFFDVGIAEGHAMTFAAGLAANGMKPVCAIYSTFAQRALDQMIHDVALQKLPVVLALDRAGLVGEDGATHHGAFDLSFTRLIPNYIIMAPSDENELKDMLYTAVNLNSPVMLRYPRGIGTGAKIESAMVKLPVGKARVLSEGRDFTIFALGNMVGPSLEAAKLLKPLGISCGVIDMRFLKPLDEKIVLETAKKTKAVAAAEENSLLGGLNSAVCEILQGSGVRMLKIGLPDSFVEHGSPKILREKYGLTAEKIADRIKSFINESSPAH